MPHKSPENLLVQIDDIARFKAGFPSLKTGMIDAVNMLKERDLRRKISDSEMRKELSQGRAIQMPIPLKAIKLCIELLAKIAVGDPSALKKRAELHQK
ncbi:MAG: hypothetical protein LBS20_14355 [Prevotella sp.]|jgi:hypothetical protein|nr:hypothetical protein [Prevotella sp.]